MELENAKYDHTYLSVFDERANVERNYKDTELRNGFTSDYNDYLRFSFLPAIRRKTKLQMFAFEEKRIAGG